MLTDARGHAHAPYHDTPRIVSLVPSITELLFTLGLGPQVVGRTTFCIHPAPELARVERVGGTKKPRIDKIRALAPTHVIVNIDENRKEDVEALEAFVPHIVVTHPITPEDNIALYQLIGGVFNRQDEMQSLCRELTTRLQRTRAPQSPPRRVLYLIWREPWMTISCDTYISRMLSLIGWTTAGHCDERRYPELEPSADWLQQEQVELVLFSSEPFPFKPEHVEEFKRLVAPRDVPCTFIDGEMVSWYGSRAIAGIDYLHDLVQRFAHTSPDI
ncbi:MAG: helical backbone metal receptor [Pseudomonadota bacterium]